jgi:uncharacterized membrane-anchored protein YhcB (DUF1043 family)
MEESIQTFIDPGDFGEQEPESESSGSTSHSGSRKPPFRGFIDGSREELLLLRSMVNHNPFMASHGAKATTWSRIVENLKNYDKDLVERKGSPMFEGVTEKSCQLKWNKLFAAQKVRVATIINATGVVVNETERERLIDQLYTDQVNSQNNKAEAKKANDQKRQKQEENKALGEALRKASMEKRAFSIDDSDTGDSSSNSSSVNSAIQPSVPLYEPKHRKKKLKLADCENIRKELQEIDEKRHEELKAQSKQQHEEIVTAFNRFADLLQKLVDK